MVDKLTLLYKILEGQPFANDEHLKSALFDLVDCSYVDANRLIDRIYSVNNVAFIAYIDKTIVGVLLFDYNNRCTIRTDDQNFTAIYNGYAVTDVNYRNQRIIQKLVAYATLEFNRRIQNDNSRLLLYAITSNPYALRAYRNVCEHMEPYSDGSFSRQGALLVTELKKELGITVREGSHPFKFTTSLPQRYSDFEQVNLENAPAAEKLFLQTLGVDEAKGDRMIFFWVPDELI